MGRVFIEETMISSGVNRVDMISLLAFIKRSGRAKTAADAIRKLEDGEFDVAELQELMIRQYETETQYTVEKKRTIIRSRRRYYTINNCMNKCAECKAELDSNDFCPNCRVRR